LLNAITECLFEAQSHLPQPIKAATDISSPHASPLAGVTNTLPSSQALPASFDVLVAEDNETNQIYVKYVLDDLGVSYKVVSNGRAAVDQWRAHNPALILMDVSMPEMNGYQATGEIRRLSEKLGRPHTPIIAVTAHTLNGDEERCLSAGMDDYISKPVSIAGLRGKLLQWKVLQKSGSLAKRL
jgi:CheY-like chemotaxis protein